jgi:hypothetical protein
VRPHRLHWLSAGSEYKYIKYVNKCWVGPLLLKARGERPSALPYEPALSMDGAGEERAFYLFPLSLFAD